MTKRLSRRALLRGAGGVAISLPFLEAMLPRSRSVAQAGTVPTRVVFFFSSCGIVPDTWWPASGGETGFVLGRALAPLEPFRSRLLIPDGISMQTARNDDVGQNGHDKGTAHCLTARTVVPGPMGVGEFGHLWDGTAGGISIDQHIANHFDGMTPYRSLEFGVRAEGIGQALPSRISYRASGEPVIPMHNAADAFDRILAPLGTGAATAAARQRRRELVLDVVDEDLDRVRGQLGSADRVRFDAHIASVEALRRQLADLAAATCDVPARPSETTQFPMLGQAQLDLMVQALKCDLTRVVSIQWSTGQSGTRFDWLGHGAGHHSISHEAGAEPSDWDASKTWRDVAIEIDSWYAQQFAYLLGALDGIVEGDGQTLLDHTIVVWVNEQEQGIDNRHSWNRMPYIVAGSGGYFRMGRHVTVSAPHGNLFVDLMQAMGMPDTTFGEPEHCTGTISGLT